MTPEILRGKQILVVDDEQDVLDILGDELEHRGMRLDRAATYEEAVEKMVSLTYDIVIFDIMGVRGFELLEYATEKKIPAVMLTAHALSLESFKKSIALGARAYLPKDQLGQVGPFLEDVLELNYQAAWKSVFERLAGSFGKRFGPEWRKTQKEFWAKLQQGTDVNEATIIRS